MDILVCFPTTPERRRRVQNAASFVQEYADTSYGLFIFENNLGGWTPALREMLKSVNRKQLVVVFGDDCEITPGTLSRLVLAHKVAFPDGDGLVQPNDQAWNGRIASFPCATAGYLLKWTYSGYIHAHADEELACVARARQKWCYLPDVLINHRHYQNTPGVLYDETYKLQESTWRHDKRLFDIRSNASNGFQNYQVLQWD